MSPHNSTYLALGDLHRHQDRLLQHSRPHIFVEILPINRRFVAEMLVCSLLGLKYEIDASLLSWSDVSKTLYDDIRENYKGENELQKSVIRLHVILCAIVFACFSGGRTEGHILISWRLTLISRSEGDVSTMAVILVLKKFQIQGFETELDRKI